MTNKFFACLVASCVVMATGCKEDFKKSVEDPVKKAKALAIKVDAASASQKKQADALSDEAADAE